MYTSSIRLQFGFPWRTLTVSRSRPVCLLTRSQVPPALRGEGIGGFLVLSNGAKGHSMSALLWAGQRHAPPSAPLIRVHNQSAREDRPEHVTLLGEFEHLPTHYLIENRHTKGRSLPCTGDVCEHCANGQLIRPAFYAPAVIHQPGDVVAGREVWTRVVYYVTPDAVNSMNSGNQRGKMFACWRQKVGSSLRFKSRFLGFAYDLTEPGFDVKPIMEHFWFPTASTAAAVQAVLRSLPGTITPPTTKRPLPKEENPSAEELAKMREVIAAYTSAKARSEETRSEEAPKSKAKHDPSIVDSVKNKIHFKGKPLSDQGRAGEGQQ